MTCSLYFHIPFCTHRCAYCDFNTYAGQESSIPAYVEALCREIEYSGRSARRAESTDLPVIHTVYFGGGTPSLLTTGQIKAILDQVRLSFKLNENAEISMEANPGTVSPAQLVELRAIGVNRLSYGVQSANAEELRMLERVHDFHDVIEAVFHARQAGFDNLNLDLIFGLPDQSLETWQTTVRRVLDLKPEHLSAYALTLEHGTPFERWIARGLLSAPDPDLAAGMYEWLDQTLAAEGYRQYEISNWSLPGRNCVHNLQYWRGLPYLGLGAGAHGYAGGVRYSNVLRIKTYIERMIAPRPDDLSFPLTPAVVDHHRQSRQDDISDFMITNLRLTRQGVSLQEFRDRFGVPLEDVYGGEIKELAGLDLLEWQGTPPARLILTPRGRLLGNRVFMGFVD